MPTYNVSQWELFLQPYTAQLLTGVLSLVFIAFALTRVHDDGWVRWAVVWAGGFSLLTALANPCLTLTRTFLPLRRLPPQLFPVGSRLYGPDGELVSELVRTIASICVFWLLAFALVAARSIERKAMAGTSADFPDSTPTPKKP